MTSLADCSQNGDPVLRTECLLQADTTDLTFCECQLCQVYTQRTYESTSPPLENAIVTTVLQPGVESNHSLCLNHWTFFRIDTAPPLVAQAWQDGDVRGERSVIDAQLGGLPDTPQQLVLTFDTEYDATYERYTTTDAFLHVADTLPIDYQKVHTALYPEPIFTPGDPPDTSKYVPFFQQDSWTYTLGYDERAHNCHNASMPSTLFLAVRCGNPDFTRGSWNRQDVPCRFRVRYVLVPQYLVGGDVLGPLPMQPLSTHAYSVLVGSYDVIRFAIRRVGDNLTYSCEDYGINCLTNGHGLVGRVTSAVDMCPTRVGNTVQLLGNDTHELRREWFCTAPGDEGRYYVAVTSDALFDASGPNPGYVLPDGQRPKAADLLEAFPGLPLNQLKPARGYYTISVRHRAFEEGPIRPGEVREGCVSYGQMRHFTVVTSGPSDASLFLNASRLDGFDGSAPSDLQPGADLRPAFSSLYVRRNRAPTRQTYDVAVHMPDLALSTTPCYVDDPYEYHILTYLADELRATVDGLQPTVFALRPRLLSASGPRFGTAQWPSSAYSSGVVIERPLSEGGGGHVCCGQFRYYVLRGVPPDVEPVVTINITSTRRGGRAPKLLALPPPLAPPAAPPHPPPSNNSEAGASTDGDEETSVDLEGIGEGLEAELTEAHAQGLFLKRLTCPKLSDVRPDRSGCVLEPGKDYSRCRIAWLVSYDEFSGEQSYLQSTVGAGGFAPLSAEDSNSDWYLGVQAFQDDPAEYTLTLSSRPRPREYRAYACNRLFHFCPAEILTFIEAGGDDGTNVTSAAAAHAARGTTTLGTASTLLACTLFWMLGLRR